MFDWRYDRPDAYGGEKSLTRKKDETLEEWKTRVNVFERKNAIASQSRFDEDERRKELVSRFKSPAVAFLFGKSMKKKIADRFISSDLADALELMPHPPGKPQDHQVPAGLADNGSVQVAKNIRCMCNLADRRDPLFCPVLQVATIRGVSAADLTIYSFSTN